MQRHSLIHQSEKSKREAAFRQQEQTRLPCQQLLGLSRCLENSPISRKQALGVLFIVILATLPNPGGATPNREIRRQSARNNSQNDNDYFQHGLSYLNGTQNTRGLHYSDYYSCPLNHALPNLPFARSSNIYSLGKLKKVAKKIKSVSEVVKAEALWSAAERLDLDFFKVALKQGLKPNALVMDRNGEEHSLLALALRHDWFELVVLLLNQGANPNFHKSTIDLPLTIAIAYSPNSISVLAAYGADMNQSIAGVSPLEYSMEVNTEAMRSLILFTPNIDLFARPLDAALSTTKKDPLVCLCQNGLPIERDEILDRLQELKRNGIKETLSEKQVNAILDFFEADYNKMQRYHREEYSDGSSLTKKIRHRYIRHAILEDDIEFIKKLKLRYLSEPVQNERGDKKYSTFHLSIKYGAVKIAAELIKIQTDLNQQDEHGHTPLAYAAIHSPQMIAFLLQHGADIEARNTENHWTAIHLAVMFNKRSLQTLIRHNADVDAFDIDGATPLMIAAMKKPEHVSVLLKAGAKTFNKKTNTSGETALHFAAQRKDTASTIILLEAGADPHVQDNSGTTPYDVATNENKKILASYRDNKTKLDFFIIFTVPYSYFVAALFVVVGICYGLLGQRKVTIKKPTIKKEALLETNVELRALNELTKDVFTAAWVTKDNKYILNLPTSDDSSATETMFLKAASQVLEKFAKTKLHAKFSYTSDLFQIEFATKNFRLTDSLHSNIRQINHQLKELSNIHSPEFITFSLNKQIDGFREEINNLLKEKMVALRKKLNKFCEEFVQLLERIEARGLHKEERVNNLVSKNFTPVIISIDSVQRELNSFFSDKFFTEQENRIASLSMKLNELNKIANNGKKTQFIKVFQDEVNDYSSQLNRYKERLNELDRIMNSHRETLSIVNHSLKALWEAYSHKTKSTLLSEAPSVRTEPEETLPLEDNPASIVKVESVAGVISPKINNAVTTPLVIIVPKKQAPHKSPFAICFDNVIDSNKNIEILLNQFTNADVDTQNTLIYGLLYCLIQIIKSYWKMSEIAGSQNQQQYYIDRLRNLLVHPACNTLNESLTQNAIFAVAVQIDFQLKETLMHKHKDYTESINKKEILIDLDAIFSEKNDIHNLFPEYKPLNVVDCVKKINVAVAKLKTITKPILVANQLDKEVSIMTAAKMLLVQIGEFWRYIFEQNLTEAISLSTNLPLIEWREGDLQCVHILDRARNFRNKICHVVDNLDLTSAELFEFIQALPNEVILDEKKLTKLNRNASPFVPRASTNLLLFQTPQQQQPPTKLAVSTGMLIGS